MSVLKYMVMLSFSDTILSWSVKVVDLLYDINIIQQGLKRVIDVFTTSIYLKIFYVSVELSFVCDV